MTHDACVGGLAGRLCRERDRVVNLNVREAKYFRPIAIEPIHSPLTMVELEAGVPTSKFCF